MSTFTGTAAHWSRLPLRALFERRDEKNRPQLPLLSVYRELGVVPREGREDNYNRPGEDLAAYKVVRPGDLVVNKMKAWQGSLGVSFHTGIVSPAYFVCKQRGSANSRFLHHLLRSQRLIAEYGSRSKGIRPSQWDLAWDSFREIHVLLPPESEQKVIADFLDAETDRIDALISKRQALLGLLHERLAIYVRSLITEAGPLSPLKRYWTVIDCKHRTPDYILGGYPVVSPGDVLPGMLDLRRCHRFVGDEDFADLTSDGRLPKRGDIIYSRNASIGIAAYVEMEDPFTMGQDVCLITSEAQDQRYLTYALNTLGKDQLDETKIGSTFSRVNVAQILELLIPTPNPQMQAELANVLDDETAKAQRCISAIRSQLTLRQAPP